MACRFRFSFGMCARVRSDASHLFAERERKLDRPTPGNRFFNLLAGCSLRVCSLAPIRDVESELRFECAVLHAHDQGRAIPERILDVSECHSSCQLVQDLLRLVSVQDRQSLLQRLPLPGGEVFGIAKITTTTRGFGLQRSVGRRWWWL